MSWSKLKTIIILILLFLNLFLLGLVGSNQLRSARYEASALSEAAAVLELNGIHVDREALPSAMTLSASTAARDIHREEALAKALLGGEVEANASGGGFYVYSAEAGSASFRSSGEFSVDLRQPLPPPADGDRCGQVRTLLEGLGLELWRVDEDGDAVTAVQSLRGAPVFPVSAVGQTSTGATFLYNEDGYLYAVSGRLFLGDVSADSEPSKPLTVPTALIAFFNFVMDSGDVCQSIREMIPVYRAAALTDPVRLTPVWRIVTDTADYFLDAATGEVTRTSGDSPRVASEVPFRLEE